VTYSYFESQRWQTPALSQDDIDKQWPGFTVTCKACGSTLVHLENDQGFSEMSGSWGGLHLRCIGENCKARVTISGD
jgi:hypothetical protein